MGSDSCRLLAVNTYSFVENNFKNNAKFNFKKFSEIVQKAQRMMDDMVDIEIELINKILNKVESDPEPDNIKAIEKETWEKLLDTCKKGRRTGLGLTGIGDTLAALGIRYGSDKSIKMTEKIYKTLCLNAYRSTCILAKERGVFPIFSHKIEKDNKFLNKIWKEDSELYKLYKKHGRRNVALTTTPPAGSISVLAQITSGIEPAIYIKYKRRKKINPNDKNARVDFIDQSGDCWQEFDVYHHKFREWTELTGRTNIEESPYYKATSNEIDWVSSIDLQAAAQKWICHSLSKTCNLPNNVSKDAIEQVYIRAWQKGCKGLTTYREGCRTGVMIQNKEDEKNKIKKTRAPKRPKWLPCDIFHTSVMGQAFFVLVGIHLGDPYEIFAGQSDAVKKNMKSGIIYKVKRGQYALSNSSNPKDRIHDDISKFVTEDQEALTRMISTSLRHGADVNFVVHQLEKTEGDLQGFSKAIARILKKYIQEGSTIHGEECPECGGKLHRAEGCISCTCGFSKCS